MKHFQRYTDKAMQAAYENACDCLYFGTSAKEWNDCGIPQSKRQEVWAVAWYDTGDGLRENGQKPIRKILREVLG